MSDPGPAGPTQFGKYLLDGQIAQGGMARVYIARLRGPGGFEKRLVVKQILPRLARDPAFVDLFVREANTLVQMSHPHIVPVYELGMVDGVYFLALEWVEGATLAQVVRRAEGGLQPAMVAHLGVQICEALRYAFTRFSVVHRDVTPRNIMVDDAGHARLLDFGIAAPVGDTGDGARFGSPGYMAPEQLRGQALGAQSDLFSLGASLYEGLAGQPAFPDRERARNVDTLDPPAPLPDTVDPALAEIVMGMLAFDPAGRPQDANAAAAALRGWLTEHCPRGIAPELGQLVAQVQKRRPTAPRADTGQHTPGSSGPAGKAVKSIATSVELRRLIDQPTERIAGPRAGEPATEPTAAITDATPPGTEELRARPSAAPEQTERTERTERIEPPAAQTQSAARAPAPAPAVPAAVAAQGGGVELRRYLWPLLALCTAGALLLLQPASAPPAPTVPPTGEDTSGTQPRGAATHGPGAQDDAGTPQDAGAARDRNATDAGGSHRSHSAPPSAPRTATRDRGPQAGRGQLSVGALPWGEVSVDGRPVGTTPLRRRSLTAGRHEVTIACPPLGRRVTTQVQLNPGQRVHLQVDLNREPAEIIKR